MNDQYIDWNSFYDALAEVTPPAAVLGVTDYLSIENYKKVSAHWASGRMPGVELVLPNLEFRITPETRRTKGINIHLLVSQRDPGHVANIEAALQRLTFVYQGQQYSCTENDLTRLGQQAKPSIVDPRKAYEEGVNQFKVDYSRFVEWYDKEGWLKSNSLVGVAAKSGDGISGLAHDGGFRAVREEIQRFADFFFSANVGDRSYWLGCGADAIEQLVERYGGTKPCVAGSDAHSASQIRNQDPQRFCWIKADPTFEGLRQIIFEPEERVHIGEHPPTRYDQSAIIRRVTVSDPCDWFGDKTVPLNEGLNCIIGERGSGKTALADMIALAGGADCDPDQSFVVRAKVPLEGTAVELTWLDGTKTAYQFGAQQPDEKQARVKYLTQGFVERICSGDLKGTELRNEIERVIFAHVPRAERLGTTCFRDLLEKRTLSTRRKRRSCADDIHRTNEQVSGLNARHAGVAQRKLVLKQKEQRRVELQKQVAGVTLKEAEKKELDEVAALAQQEQFLQEQLGKVNVLALSIQQVRALRDDLMEEVGRYRERILPLLKALGFDERHCQSFIPAIASDCESLLSAKQNELTRSIALLKGGDSKATPGTAEAMGLTAAQKRKRELQTRIKELLDRKKAFVKAREDIAALVKDCAAEQAEITRIEKQYKDDGARLRRVRHEKMAEVLRTVAEEKKSLEQLYEPLRRLLQQASQHERRLDLYVRRTVDLESWADEGRRLLDGRRARSLVSDRRLYELAHESLAHCLENETPTDIGASYDALVKKMQEEEGRKIREMLRRNVTAEQFAGWLYSLEHVSTEYGIRYDGTELENLSPGTRGLVLLILYLSLNTGNVSPLIVDQPEENLDNQSVFLVLRSYLRRVKSERQIVVITHNPNLVVNTDAEQVIVSKCRKKASGQPNLSYSTGSLESQTPVDSEGHTIRDEVCRLLEGGTEAFQLRERRYSSA